MNEEWLCIGFGMDLDVDLQVIRISFAMDAVWIFVGFEMVL